MDYFQTGRYCITLKNLNTEQSYKESNCKHTRNNVPIRFLTPQLHFNQAKIKFLPKKFSGSFRKSTLQTYCPAAESEGRNGVNAPSKH